MNFSALIITEEQEYKYRELNELLLSIDFEVDFVSQLSSDLSWVSNIGFKYDLFFLLKEPSEVEVPAVSSLSKMKVMFIKPDGRSLVAKSKKGKHWLNSHGVFLEDYLEVVDEEKNAGDIRKIILSSASMKSKPAYFEEVDRIAAFEPFNICGKGWEVVLNGNRSTKALLGELITRAGRDVCISIRKDNLIVFACDIFSNEPMRIADNGKFIENLTGLMLEGADIVD